MDKWISVKNALPRGYKDVILINDGEIGIGYYDAIRNEWYDYTKKDILNITHWMPAPELPEEE